MKYKIMFEHRKVRDKEQQIKFSAIHSLYLQIICLTLHMG